MIARNKPADRGDDERYLGATPSGLPGGNAMIPRFASVRVIRGAAPVTGCDAGHLGMRARAGPDAVPGDLSVLSGRRSGGPTFLPAPVSSRICRLAPRVRTRAAS